MFVSESYLDDVSKKSKRELRRAKRELKKAKRELKKASKKGLKYAEKGLDYFENTEGGQSHKAQKVIYEPMRKAKQYLKDRKKQKKEN